MSAGRPRVTIRTRLTLTYGGLFAAAGAAMIGLLYVFMKYVPVYSENLTTGRPDQRDGTPTGLPSIRMTPHPDSMSLTWSPDCEASSPGGVAAFFDRVGAFFDRVTSPSDGTSSVAHCMSPSGGVTSLQVSTKADFLEALLVFSAMALLILLVMAVVLGWFVAGRMLAPLQRITTAARGIAGSTLHERIALAGPKDEIRELADTFDGMLERLHKAFQAQNRFAANASHELRTPLAGMRTVLQVALAAPHAYRLEDLGPKLLTLNRRSTEITEALLTLARADHGAVVEEDVRLGVLVQEMCAQTKAQAERAGVTLTASGDQGRLRGDRVLLRQLVVNLVDNAVRHNHRGGSVTVRVDERPDGDVRLVVRNTGRKLSRTEADRAFEPFHRLDTRQASRSDRPSGHGLGLAIVESIVRAHGGTLRAEPPRDGGLEITVTLPTAGP
ncbi:ATP-binding protein [Sphaerisporangium sp. NBC_01403]|uniref:sensor histidine kinase n=1 Tax=Sphaerisporangium sp. NBC_01403 TaxID=2903599 RepID=UPI0032485D5F